MTKVITYGTYDVLHYGHIRLLERAKALGDYLIVGVTSDDYDITRGKINNKQSLAERMENVRKLGIADEIIVEEYEGQKIDDIKKYGVDIFTVGSDWVGKFDYLNEYCKVVYLDRTQGISSSELRSQTRSLKVLVEGHSPMSQKFVNESKYVNGVEVALDESDYDAIYLVSKPENHYKEVKKLLEEGKHVLCESPLALKEAEAKELFEFAKSKNLILMEGIKTAFATAFARLVLLVKTGNIGDVVSVDVTCTSLADELDKESANKWGAITAWGPTALLPIFQILGVNYRDINIISHIVDEKRKIDGFTKIDFVYDKAVASIKVAKTAKSEGEMVITGTKGYIYVGAPWWKTDYFEIRYEDTDKNKRFFYQLDGEGIRNEIVEFVKAVEVKKNPTVIEENVSLAIAKVMEKFLENKKYI